MFKAWGFVVALALCCTSGSSMAHASAKAKVFKAIVESAAGGFDIANKKLHLRVPLKLEGPKYSYKLDELDAPDPKLTWLGTFCALLAPCRHYIDEKTLGTK